MESQSMASAEVRKYAWQMLSTEAYWIHIMPLRAVSRQKRPGRGGGGAVIVHCRRPPSMQGLTAG
jgi:hypothetical protein